MKENSYVYFETYGCTANQNNTEIMKSLCLESGLQTTSNLNIADIIIINTCIVKGKTEKKIERRIYDLLKNQKNKPIIVAGCMPEVRKNKLQNKNLYLLGTHHFKEITRLIKAIIEKKYNQDYFTDFKNEEKLLTGKIPQNSKISIIQISEGCLGNCSFCLTRKAKGKLCSYSQKNILNQIKSDLNFCKEIWITSQDNASYGLDSGKRKLPELLKEILKLKGNFKIRLGMSNPENVLPILDELIEIYKNKKMYKFLHIPIQSGSNEILKKMNRKYCIKDFLKIVRKFKNNFPNLVLSTDIIVGFPQETEKDFSKTLDIIKKTSPDLMNISRFWARKGTRAEKFKQIPVNIIKKRLEKIFNLHKKQSLENYKKLLGKKLKCLVSQKQENQLIARDESYRIIILNTNKKLLGKKVNVKIIKSGIHYLVGEVI